MILTFCPRHTSTVSQVGLITCETMCIRIMTRRDIPLLQRIETINQERGSNASVRRSVVSVTGASVSLKWMKNQNKCDTSDFYKLPLHDDTG